MNLDEISARLDDLIDQVNSLCSRKDKLKGAMSNLSLNARQREAYASFSQRLDITRRTVTAYYEIISAYRRGPMEPLNRRFDTAAVADDIAELNRNFDTLLAIIGVDLEDQPET